MLLFGQHELDWIEPGIADTIRILHVGDHAHLLELASTFAEGPNDKIIVETCTDPTEVADQICGNGALISCIVSNYDKPSILGTLENHHDRTPRSPVYI